MSHRRITYALPFSTLCGVVEGGVVEGGGGEETKSTSCGISGSFSKDDGNSNDNNTRKQQSDWLSAGM